MTIQPAACPEPDKILFSSRFTSVSGFKIHFLANTDSEPPKKPELCPIVLVHGLNISGRYMLPLAKILGTLTPVLIPDFPGFGRSSKPWPPLSLRRLAAVAAGLPAALGYNQAHFVGNSFGCQIIIELAAFFPRSFDALSYKLRPWSRARETH